MLRLYGPAGRARRQRGRAAAAARRPDRVWWPGAAPDGAAPRTRSGGWRSAAITDAAAERNPVRALQQRAAGHAPGDTDLAWTRITQWRALLAAALDQPPFESVTRAVVSGSSDSASTDLLAAWLAMNLKCPVTRKRTPAGHGMDGVVLHRASGPVTLQRGRRQGGHAQPARPARPAGGPGPARASPSACRGAAPAGPGRGVRRGARPRAAAAAAQRRFRVLRRLAHELAERAEAHRPENRPLGVDVVLRGAAAREGHLTDHERVLTQLGDQAVRASE